MSNLEKMEKYLVRIAENIYILDEKKITINKKYVRAMCDLFVIAYFLLTLNEFLSQWYRSHFWSDEKYD